MNLTFTICAFAALLLAGLTFAVSGMPGSSKTFEIVVPFPPGGPVDVFARALEADFAKDWSRLVTVENNKPGAVWMIGGVAVAGSLPNGTSI